METVEKTTTAITGPVIDDRDGTSDAASAGALQPPKAATSDPWATVVQAGLTLLQDLAAASRVSSPGPGPDGLRFVQRDPDTGQPYLRIPLPNAEVLGGALDAIGQLLGRIRA